MKHTTTLSSRWLLAACMVGSLLIPVIAEAAAARGRTVRSSGSVRQSGATRSGGTVTQGKRVVTPAGSKTVTRSVSQPRVVQPKAVQPRVVRRPVHGHTVRTLPAGYRTVYVGGKSYYYHGGVYFVRRYSSGVTTYVVVDEPLHAVIYVIPADYEEVVIEGHVYYTDHRVYYSRIYQGGRVSYRVVRKP